MKRLLFICVCFLTLAVIGCEGTPTGKEDLPKYTLFGLAEKNLDEDKDHLYLEFKANGAAIGGSFAVVGTDTLAFDNSGTLLASSPQVNWTVNQNVAVTVYDTSADFSRTVLATMPGSFAINSFSPPSYRYQSGQVTINWDPSVGASGFFVTCVARTDGSPATGFAELDLEGLLAESFGAEAFIDNHIFPPDRVIDSFYVYVVAYNTTFYPYPGPKYLDTPEVDKLDFPNSNMGTNIAGAFGAAVVCVREAFDVVASQ